MVDIVVPQVGETTAEVVLVRWLKREGDAVDKGDPLFEVDTDKYVVEIEAFASGTLTEILVPEGSAVLPRQVVGRLVVDGRWKEATQTPATADPPPVGTPPSAVSAADANSRAEQAGRVQASPKARRLAAELGVDLAGVTGTSSGPDGLVTAKDVERAAASRRSAPANRLIPRPLSRARWRVAERTQASKREVPHFYLLLDVDMSEAERLRGECLQALGWERPPTVTALVVAACARALESLPEVNVQFSDEGLLAREQANVGIAVDVPDGLVVPVLSDAGRLSLRELNERAQGLVARAREGRLLEADVSERSMVVSNLGMHGVDAFVAIIDVPDPMILAVGRVSDRCVAVHGAPAVRPTCTLALSADHRALDGADGARFLAAVKERLEHPFEFLEA